MSFRKLTDEELDQAREIARTHACDTAQWALYHPALREIWRTYFGHGWGERQALLPVFEIPKAPERKPFKPCTAASLGLPPSWDERPPDPKGPKPLTPRGVKARKRAAWAASL